MPAKLLHIAGHCNLAAFQNIQQNFCAAKKFGDLHALWRLAVGARRTYLSPTPFWVFVRRVVVADA